MTLSLQAATSVVEKSAAGLHLIGDLYECATDKQYMLDANALRDHCVALVRESGLTVVGELFHQFPGDGGVTGVVVLAESHLSIHTWPERNYVTIDVYVCNYSCNNRGKAQVLFDSLIQTFRPADPRLASVDRA